MPGLLGLEPAIPCCQSKLFTARNTVLLYVHFGTIYRASSVSSGRNTDEIIMRITGALRIGAIAFWPICSIVVARKSWRNQALPINI